MSARTRWQTLDADRAVVLQRARECASLTIPSLLPPAGANQNTILPTPFQSLGARGVNNIASKLLLALFPSNSSFFRLRVAEQVLTALGGRREAVEEVLRKIENDLMLRIETSNLRAVIHSALKHLVVVGNALLYLPRNGQARMYRMSDYCVVRTPSGMVTEIVIREETYPDALSPEIRARHKITAPPGSRTPVEIFTHVRLSPDGDTYVWHQEINDIRVLGANGRAPVDESPFIVLRWQATEGEDYARSMVEEYLGDLRSLEGLQKAIIQFAAAASKIIFLTHPNATTDEDELIDAESGAFVTGRKDDIDVLQIEKYADFQVANAVADKLELRLSAVFLLQAGTVRDAERVTAEEIRAVAQELEDALGGVYTVQSQEFQLPLVRRLMRLAREEKSIPAFPRFRGRSAIQPTIVTGFDALGRGHELNRFRAFYADLQGILGPNGATALMVPTAVAQKLATSHNVDIGGLIKTEEQLAEEAEEQQAAALAEKAAGPVAGAAARGMFSE